jgi:hypothetical protein
VAFLVGAFFTSVFKIPVVFLVLIFWPKLRKILVPSCAGKSFGLILKLACHNATFFIYLKEFWLWGIDGKLILKLSGIKQPNINQSKITIET